MQKNNYRANTVVETGLIIAITLVIIIMTAYMPILLDLGMFILPIPAVLIYIRHNFQLSLLSIILSALIASLIYNPIEALGTGVIYGLTALTLGYYLKNKKNSGITIVMVALAAALGKIVQFTIYAFLVTKIGIIKSLNLLVDQLKESLQYSKEIYIRINAPKEAVEYVDNVMKYVNLENLVIILTVVFIIGGLLQSYISYLISQKILLRLNYTVKDIIPFSRIYMPNKIEALFIIIACIGIILNSKGINKFSYLFSLSNVLVLLTVSLDGMACFAYVLKEKARMPKVVTFMMLIIISFIPIFSNLYFMLGLMDIIFNLRKLDPDPIRKIKSRE